MERIASKTYLIQNCLMGRKFDKLMIGGKNGKHMVNKRKKDNNRTILIFVLIAVFFLCACHSNQIWFDCQTNTVYSVEDYPIRELNVTMVNAKKSFWISKIDTLKGESCIKLDMYAWVNAKSLQSCPVLCDPMDCSPPGSSVHGFLQARILEWLAISFSRGSY